MNVSRIPNRLALLAAFLLCITLGFTLAVILRERLGSTAQEDPCFGQGEVVDSWQRELTQEDIDRVVSASRPDLADLEPGTIEYRRCRSGPGFEVIIDEMGHVYSYFQPTIEELEAYYKEHPEENPWNELATRQAEKRVTDFVTPPLPTAAPLAETILAGCEPTWDKEEFPQTGLRVCFPSGWAVRQMPPEANIDSGIISITFEPKPAGEVSLDCPEPAVIKAPVGDAHVCSYRPNIGEVGQGHQIALPNGHKARFFIAEPTDENTALALRIALAADELP